MKCHGNESPELAHRYNHKLMKLAEAVLREVVDFKVEEDRFQVSQPSSVMPTVMPTDQSIVLPQLTLRLLQKCMLSYSNVSVLSVD